MTVHMPYIVGQETNREVEAVRILLADDHPLFREGVKQVLQRLADSTEIVEATDYPSAFALAGQFSSFDLALLDLYMPGMAGIDGVIRFRETFPSVPVVVVSAAEERSDIKALLGRGALGYISKTSPTDVILGALQLVLAGGVYVPAALLSRRGGGDSGATGESGGPYASLTRRHIDVLRHLASGASNRQIAQRLNVTEGTVKIHLSTIFRILGVRNRTEAVLIARKMGLGARK